MKTTGVSMASMLVRGCLGKPAYPTRAVAVAAIGRRAQMMVYPCRSGAGHFHIGHRVPRRRRR
jgi:hypothetical protein